MENQNPPSLWKQLLIVPKVFYKLVKAGWTYRDTLKFIYAILKQGR